MIRNILAFVGLVALLGGLAVLQFGWISSQIQESRARIEAQQAQLRVAQVMREAQREAVGLSNRATELHASARKLEMASERESESVAKTRLAISKLADAAKQAGLPKPSQAKSEHLAKEIQFAGRTLSGADVYRTLERWQTQWQLGDRRQETMQAMIERLRAGADQLQLKQETLSTHVSRAKSRSVGMYYRSPLALESLETRLVELETAIQEADSDNLDKALDTIQVEIDESLLAMETYRSDPGDADLLTPEEALAGTEADDTIKQELDKLWE